jgi:hypothetical protein
MAPPPQFFAARGRRIPVLPSRENRGARNAGLSACPRPCEAKKKATQERHHGKAGDPAFRARCWRLAPRRPWWTDHFYPPLRVLRRHQEGRTLADATSAPSDCLPGSRAFAAWAAARFGHASCAPARHHRHPPRVSDARDAPGRRGGMEGSVQNDCGRS